MERRGEGCQGRGDYTQGIEEIDIFKKLDTLQLLGETLTQHEFDVRFGALKSKTYKTTKIMV